MKKRVIALLLGLCLISMSACGGKTAFHLSDEMPASRNEKSSEPDRKQAVKEDSKASDRVEQSEQEEKSSSEEELGEETSNNDERDDATQDIESIDTSTDEQLVEGMRPAFKEAMDSYEKFMTEYCEFIKIYSESNGTDQDLLADYTDYMLKYADRMQDFEAYDIVTITIPQAQVLDCKVDETTLTEDSFIVAKGSAAVEAEHQTAAFQEAQARMQESASSDTALLANAQQRAQKSLEDYVHNIGDSMGKAYKIKWIYLEGDEPTQPETTDNATEESAESTQKE